MILFEKSEFLTLNCEMLIAANRISYSIIQSL